MVRKAAVWLVVLMAAACSQEQSSSKVVQTATASEIPVGADESRRRPADDDETRHKPEPVATKANFELQTIGAYTWTVLSGERLCVDESSMKRTCVEVGESLYPGSGSLFLDVAVELKNLGSEPGNMSAGDLIATYGGKNLRYALIEREQENSVEIPPLGKGMIHAYYEVPIDVLNEATFAVDLGSEKPIGFEFETPNAQEQRKGAMRAAAAMKAEEERALDREQEAVYSKCWALNDRETPMVAREEFGWYVESCSHMYDVGDYETYLKVYQSRS
jgi:hypothetical protein